MEELHVAGRLPCKQETFQSGLGKEKAENMLKNGWNEKVIWEADTKCNVQSESDPNVSYRVDFWLDILPLCPKACSAHTRQAGKLNQIITW